MSLGKLVLGMGVCVVGLFVVAGTHVPQYTEPVVAVAQSSVHRETMTMIRCAMVEAVLNADVTNLPKDLLDPRTGKVGGPKFRELTNLCLRDT